MPIADQSKWKLSVCALDGSFPSGSGQVFNAANKQFTYNINAGRQGQFAINIDNPRANYILSNDCLLKAYRRNRLGAYSLFMVGDIITAEESSQGDIGIVTVAAADPFWRLQHRLIPQSISLDSRGRGLGWSNGTIAADGITINFKDDVAQMIQDMVGEVNTVWYTGITGGILQTSYQSTVGPVYAAYAGDQIQQMCATLGGPDFELAPHEPSGTWPGVTIATLNLYTHLGSIAIPPAAIFQYGAGKKNVASYTRLLDKSNKANVVYSLPPGFPSVNALNDSLVGDFDGTSILNSGLYEYIVSMDTSSVVGSGSVTPLRQELVDETVSILSHARQQVTFVPTVNCNLDFGVDYNVGDIVGAQAYDITTKTWRFNGTARLYGVQFTIDDNDSESAALTLIPGG